MQLKLQHTVKGKLGGALPCMIHVQLVQRLCGRAWLDEGIEGQLARKSFSLVGWGSHATSVNSGSYVPDLFLVSSDRDQVEVVY